MNFKLLTLSVLIATIFISASLFAPTPTEGIPSNKTPCNTCHSAGGVGSLVVTLLDGTKPANNVFTIAPGDTIGISVYGSGAQDQNEPGVALIFEQQLHHHLTVKGASPGGEGSNAWYVRDGDANDLDPKVSNVKGSFQITADDTTPGGEFSVTANYQQAGPSGVNVVLIVKVAGEARTSSSISLLVSPNEVYANNDVVYISGGIRPADVDHVDIQIRSGEDWQTLTLVKPGPAGNFFYEWRPTKIEEYSLRAIFEGNKRYEPVESQEFSVSVKKSPETFTNQVMSALGLGLMIILIGIGLFYIGGRSRYLRQVGRRI